MNKKAFKNLYRGVRCLLQVESDDVEHPRYALALKVWRSQYGNSWEVCKRDLRETLWGGEVSLSDTERALTIKRLKEVIRYSLKENQA